MIGLKRTILGISDLKNLFQSIKSSYSVDFSDYALSSLKRRIESFMYRFHVLSIDDLIHKIEKDSSFYDLFFDAILVDTTEMFRDPEFWEEFSNTVLKKYKNSNGPKIWIPDSNSGDEVYTIQILLSKLGLDDQADVFVSSMSERNIDRIKKASIDHKKMELNSANYERFEEDGDLMEHFSLKANVSILKPELLKSVTIEKHNLFMDKSPGTFDIILFRNKLLYFNPQLKIEAIKKLSSALKPGGYFAIGVKELLEYPSWEQDFALVSETEKIYKKYIN